MSRPNLEPPPFLRLPLSALFSIAWMAGLAYRLSDTVVQEYKNQGAELVWAVVLIVPCISVVAGRLTYAALHGLYSLATRTRRPLSPPPRKELQQRFVQAVFPLEPAGRTQTRDSWVRVVRTPSRVEIVFAIIGLFAASFLLMMPATMPALTRPLVALAGAGIMIAFFAMVSIGFMRVPWVDRLWQWWRPGPLLMEFDREPVVAGEPVKVRLIGRGGPIRDLRVMLVCTEQEIGEAQKNPPEPIQVGRAKRVFFLEEADTSPNRPFADFTFQLSPEAMHSIFAQSPHDRQRRRKQGRTLSWHLEAEMISRSGFSSGDFPIRVLPSRPARVTRRPPRDSAISMAPPAAATPAAVTPGAADRSPCKPHEEFRGGLQVMLSLDGGTPNSPKFSPGQEEIEVPIVSPGQELRGTVRINSEREPWCPIYLEVIAFCVISSVKEPPPLGKEVPEVPALFGTEPPPFREIADVANLLDRVSNPLRATTHFPFSLKFPELPLSYDGYLFKIEWFIGAYARGHSGLGPSEFVIPVRVQQA